MIWVISYFIIGILLGAVYSYAMGRIGESNDIGKNAPPTIVVVFFWPAMCIFVLVVYFDESFKFFAKLGEKHRERSNK